MTVRNRPLRDDDELALHQADDVLRRVEIGAREVVEHLLELPVVEHELERVELRRGQLAPLAVPTPLAGKLRDLTPQELDIFQLVLDHGQVQAVLDNYYGTDLEAAQCLVGLMQREFIVVP